MHNLLAVGADGDELLVPPQHRPDDSLGGQSLADGESQDTARFFPRWTEFQSVLRRVFLFLAVVTDRCPSESLAGTRRILRAGEHLRRPVGERNSASVNTSLPVEKDSSNASVWPHSIILEQPRALSLPGL